MSSKRQRTAGKTGQPSGKASRSGPQPHGEERPKWWKRPVTWVIAFISALVLAAAGALGQGIGGTIFAGAKSLVPKSAPTPVKIEQVTALSNSPDNSFALPHKVQLTKEELAELNGGNASYFAAFQAAHHAVPTGSGSIGITVEGNSNSTVTITGLKIIKQCQSPLTGSYFYNPPAGENTTISLGFDLDSQITYAQDTRAGENYSGNWFLEHVVTLAPGEPQTFTVFLATARHYCQFSFQLTVATPQGTVTEEIPASGKKFELTASDQNYDPESGTINLSSYQSVYVGGVADAQNNNEWIAVNPKTYNGIGNPASFPPSAAGT
jgi:hypothetical protein